MDPEIVVAIIGGATTIGGSLLTYLGTRRSYQAKIDELREERQNERERSFEQAQIGYRKLYEKFRKHSSQITQTGQGLDKLNDDREEIRSVGFKPVCDTLEAYWPEEQRLANKPPNREKLPPLEQAMILHGSMRLAELDQMKARGEA